jgi:hypothetical protein
MPTKRPASKAAKKTSSSKRTSKTSSKSSTGASAPVHVDGDSSIGVRKIENGFIVSESGTTGKGKNKQYYSKEYFSKVNPVKISGLKNQAPPKGRFGSKKK